MTEPKNYLSPQENLKQHYKSQAQKGANAVRSGREEFAKDYIEPTAKMAGSFSPLGPMIGIMDAFNAYKKGDTAGAVIGAGLEALPYGLSKAKTITNFLKPPKKFVPNPEAYYRMIGDVEGVDDAIKSGVIRPNQTGIFSNRKAYYTKGKPNDVNNPIINDGVKKGTYYKGPYMIEVSPGEYFPIRETNLPQWEFGITKPGEHIPINADNVKIYKQHWLRGYKEVPKKQKGGNIDLYNRLNPGGGFPNWDPRKFFNLGSVIDNGILYTFGGGKSRKGTNLATPEEEAYWKLYNNIPQDLVKPTDVRINADKGDNTSEFVGMPDSMLERIAAIADTTNTGKMLRNFSQYEEKLKPINKLGLEKIYNFGKQLLNNPGKGQQAHETLSLKTSDNGKTGLGALQSFGMVWDKDKKVIKAYDTYDFPDYLNMFIPKRDKTLKIRGEIKFDPVKGSKILNDKDYSVKQLKK